MTLRLVEPPPEIQATTDINAQIREAALALADLLDVENDHLQHLIGSCLQTAHRSELISAAERRGIRPAGQPKGDLAVRLGRAAGLIDRLPDPYTIDNDKVAKWTVRQFKIPGGEIKHQLPELLRADARADEDREWELYRARWQESDLPREPELRHTARRALVRGGIWMRSQVRKRSDAELLAIENVGPKTVAQLREAIDD